MNQTCNICCRQYNVPSALYFTTPEPDGTCSKVHICPTCDRLTATFWALLAPRSEDVLPEDAYYFLIKLGLAETDTSWKRFDEMGRAADAQQTVIQDDVLAFLWHKFGRKLDED